MGQSRTHRRVWAMGALLGALALGGCETVSDMLSPQEKIIIKGERVAVLNKDSAVMPDPKLDSVPVKLPKPYANEDWTQPGGTTDNALHHLSASGELRQLWRAGIGQGSSSDGKLLASPIIGGGSAFTLDTEGQVVALDLATGSLLWRTDLTPEDTDSDKGFGGGVAYGNGRVFVSTGFGFVAALDAKTGKEIWRRAGSVPYRMAPVVSGGRVYVATQENQLFAIAADDGRVLWDHRGIAEPAAILRSNSVAVSGELVVVPYSSGELYALRAQTGRVAWSDTLSRGGQLTPLASLSDIAGRPVIDRNFVFAMSHAGRLVAIDGRTGERVWTIDVGGIQRPWVAGDFVFAVTDDSRVICVTRADGKIRWSTQLPAYRNLERKRDPIVWSGPVLASDRLVLLSSQGEALSLSPYTGEVLGRIGMPDGVFIAPVVAQNKLFILTDDAELFAFQ